MLFGLGLLDAMHWTRGRPSGCAYLMIDADTIEQIGASWFPPSVTCRFTSFQYEWIERQHAWGYYLPVALFVAAACCAWYAIRHRTPYGHLPGPWWQPVALAATLLVLVVLTLIGLIAMAWQDGTKIALLPFVTIPVASVWTMHCLRWISGAPVRLRRGYRSRVGWP
jgi:hypothetical protein